MDINNIDYIIYLMSKYTISEPKNKRRNKKEMGEQDSAAGGGGSSKAAPYPTVTKWTSGRKFGPTYNPEQKKWTSNLTRGKANTLL